MRRESSYEDEEDEDVTYAMDRSDESLFSSGDDTIIVMDAQVQVVDEEKEMLNDKISDLAEKLNKLSIKLMEKNEEMKNITLNNTFLQDENQKLKNHIKQIKESGSEVEMQTCKEIKSEFNTFRNDLDNFKKFITENITANTVEPTTSKDDDTNMGVPTAANLATMATSNRSVRSPGIIHLGDIA